MASKRRFRSKQTKKVQSLSSTPDLQKASRTSAVPHLRPFRSLVVTLGIQIASFSCAFLVVPLLFLPLPQVFIHLLSALALARLARLSVSWQLCNALIPLGLLADIGPLLPFSLFVFTLLIFGPTLLAPIPFYPTRRGIYGHLSNAIAHVSPRRCVDLGSGFGSVIFALARHFPDTSFIGYEIGLIPLLVSRIRSWCYRNVTMYRESFWQTDLAEFDLVYAFLSPPPMVALEEKLHRELSDNALFITNSFPLPHSTPSHTIVVGGQSLLFYRRRDIRVT